MLMQTLKTLNNVLRVKIVRKAGHNEETDVYLNVIVMRDSLFYHKKNYYIEASINLRNEGVVTTPGTPFMQSQQKEIKALIPNGVFEFIQLDPFTLSDIRLFKSRMANEVKRKATTTACEKSRIVIQAYKDDGKK